MIVINARNVNDAAYQARKGLDSCGVESRSRVGDVIRYPLPVTTCYQRPQERVIFLPERDANPFFHLVESLWMLAGRNDLPLLTKYVKRMASFSDDGGRTQPGAYGYRWRRHFDRDQLSWAIERLRADPYDRRVVIQMYDPDVDHLAADKGGADVPCNLSVIPFVLEGNDLSITVFNRSNDMVWGAYGANAVHFSVLQEYLASQLGLGVGPYFQVSNNLHAYKSTVNKISPTWPWMTKQGTIGGDPYAQGIARPMTMFNGFDARTIDEDLELFLEDPAKVGLRLPFLRKVACPMVMAYRAWKESPSPRGLDRARKILAQIPADNDWRMGSEIWFNHREAKMKRASEDGVQYEI